MEPLFGPTLDCGLDGLIVIDMVAGKDGEVFRLARVAQRGRSSICSKIAVVQPPDHHSALNLFAFAALSGSAGERHLHKVERTILLVLQCAEIR